MGDLRKDITLLTYDMKGFRKHRIRISRYNTGDPITSLCCSADRQERLFLLTILPCMLGVLIHTLQVLNTPNVAGAILAQPFFAAFRASLLHDPSNTMG